MFKIRDETPEDVILIHALNVRAFPNDAEAKLVVQLRKNQNLTVSLIAENSSQVVGHIAFSPVTLAPHESPRGLGLAPLAVLPEFQNQRIGSQLIREGLKRCQALGYEFVVVLGHPAYYQRFGFRPASQWQIRNEYGVDQEFMLIEFQRHKLPAEGGLAQYSAEFKNLG